MAHDKMFVISAWTEGEEWRFEIRHVQSAETQYFANLQDLAAYLQGETGVALLETNVRSPKR